MLVLIGFFGNPAVTRGICLGAATCRLRMAAAFVLIIAKAKLQPEPGLCGDVF